MTHALALTAADRRYLDAAKSARRTRIRETVTEEEIERRARIVRKGVAHAGSRWQLHKATGIPDGTLSDWLRGRRPVPLDRLAAIETFLRESAPCAKRQSAQSWCPGCAQSVPSSQMRTFEGGRWITLDVCKRCKCGTAPSSRSLGAGFQGGTDSAC